MRAVLMMIVIMGPILAEDYSEVSIRVRTDSQVAEIAATKFYARTEPLASVLRALVVAAELCKARLEVDHIPGI